MEGIEKVVKHLEMTQGVINRLGHDSFLIKGWSATIISLATILMARLDVQNPYILMALIIFIIGFWGLDGYFLQQERLFREIYDDVRQREDTDFKMDIGKHLANPKCSWASATFSKTLLAFYLIEIAFVIFASVLIGEKIPLEIKGLICPSLDRNEILY